jgi:hypothetical protein
MVKPEKTPAASAKSFTGLLWASRPRPRTEDYLALRKDTIMRESPSREDDLMIATISGLLAWIITLALRTAFGG